jgi:O-methyltransferase domain
MQWLLHHCCQVCQSILHDSWLQVASLDFFADPFPRADVIMLGMILHDWGTAKKQLLIGKVSSSPVTTGYMVMAFIGAVHVLQALPVPLL